MEPYNASMIICEIRSCKNQIKIFAQHEMFEALSQKSIKNLEFMNQSPYGLPNYTADQITEGLVCLTRLTVGESETYCRAQVTDASNIHEGIVEVALPDYKYWPTSLAISNIYEGQHFCNSPLPSEIFIMADISPTQNEGWSRTSINFLEQQLCGKSIIGSIFRINNQLPLFRPFDHKGKSFANSMVEFGMALECPLEMIDSSYTNNHISQNSSDPSYNSNGALYANPSAMNGNKYSSLITSPLPQVKFIVQPHEGFRGKCHIIGIERGPVRFSARLETMESNFTILNEMLENLRGNVNFQPADIQIGNAVLHQDRENSYYRAVITELNAQARTATIYFIDFGENLTVSFDTLHALPIEISKIPMLSLRCRLQDMKHHLCQQVVANFKELAHMHLSISIEKMDADRLYEVYMEYMNHSVLKIITQKIYDQQTLVSGSEVIATRMHKEEGIVFLQSVDNKDQLSLLETRLEKCALSAPLLGDNPVRGLPCLVYHNEEQKWYRGLVLKFDAENIAARLVDTGRQIVVNRKYIRKISETLLYCLPAQATPVSIGEFSNRTSDVKNINQSMLEGSFIASVLSTVAMKIDGIKETIPKVSLDPTYSHASSSHSSAEEDSIIPNLLKQCKITFIESPSLFYVVFLEKIHVFEELSKVLMKTAVESFRPPFNVNQHVVLQGDDMCYRCLVEQVMNESIRVRLIDKGGSITAKKYQVKCLPNELTIDKLAPLAIKCGLHGYSDCLGDEFKQKFTSSFINQQAQVNFVAKDDDIWKVSLLKTEDMMNDLLSSTINERSPPAAERVRPDTRISPSNARETKSARKPSDSDNWRSPPADSKTPPEWPNSKEQYSTQNKKADFNKRQSSRPHWRMDDDRDTVDYCQSSKSTSWSKQSSADWSSETPKSRRDTPRDLNSEWDSCIPDTKQTSHTDWTVNSTRSNSESKTSVQTASKKSSDWADPTDEWGFSSQSSKGHFELSDLATPNALSNNECVYVSYFDDETTHLWLQKSSDLNKLKDLQSSLQNTRRHENKKEYIDNELCLAKSAEDQTWYRGLITSMDRNFAYVYFVDFGNSEKISKYNVKKMAPNLLTYPPLAYPCTFQTNVDQASLMTQIEEEFKVQIISKNENFDIVSLTCNGKIHGAQPSTVQTYTAVNQSKVENLFISHIDEDGSIWVQKAEFSADLEVLMENLENFAKDCDIPSMLEIGKIYCVKFSKDEEWYRGKVLSTMGNEAFVHYVDYGNSEQVTITDVRELPLECATLGEQALCCILFDAEPGNKILGSLHNIPWLLENEIEAELITGSSGTNLLRNAKLQGQNLQRKIIAELGGTQGSSPSSTQPSWASVPEVTVKTNMTIPFYLSYIEDDGTVWIQPKQTFHELTALMKNIDNYIKSNSSSLIPAKEPFGKYCISKFEDDGEWCRIFINGVVSDTHFEGHFIDYGNTDEVRRTETFPLPESLSNLPCQAIHCQLDVLQNVGTITDDLNEALNSLSESENLTGKIKNSSSSIYILEDLHGCDVNLSEFVVPKSSQSCTLSAEVPCVQKAVSSEQMQSGTGNSFLVSFVETDGCIWIQRLETSDALDTLMESLKSHSENASPLELSEGKLCLAKYSEDDSWYRGKVLSYNEAEAVVHYIDYGNSEVVVLDDLRELPEECKSLPAQAIQCNLFKPGDKICSLIHEISWIMDAFLTGTLQEISSRVFFLRDAVIDGQDLVAKIKDELQDRISLDSSMDTTLGSSGITTVPSEERLKEKQAEPLEELLVSFVDKDSSIWVQKCETTDQLDSLMEEVESLAKSSAMIVPSVGILCLAKYPIDSAWYRGKVISFNTDEALIHFIDYGNQDNIPISELREIPGQCILLPGQAIQCKILDSQDQELSFIDDISWLNEAVIKGSLQETSGFSLLKDPIINGESICSKIKRDLCSSLNERSKEENNEELENPNSISQVPISLTSVEEISDIIDVPQGTYSSLLVTFIEKDGTVWTQKKENIDDLDVLMEEIEALVESCALFTPVEGMLCLAKYPLDSAWYRGKVMSFTDNEALIHFVDYGNTDTVPVPDLREIPNYCTTLPMQAIHCQIFDNLDQEICALLHAIPWLPGAGIEGMLFKGASDLHLLKDPVIDGENLKVKVRKDLLNNTQDSSVSDQLIDKDLSQLNIQSSHENLELETTKDMVDSHDESTEICSAKSVQSPQYESEDGTVQKDSLSEQANNEVFYDDSAVVQVQDDPLVGHWPVEPISGHSQFEERLSTGSDENKETIPSQIEVKDDLGHGDSQSSHDVPIVDEITEQETCDKEAECPEFSSVIPDSPTTKSGLFSNTQNSASESQLGSLEHESLSSEPSELTASLDELNENARSYYKLSHVSDSQPSSMNTDYASIESSHETPATNVPVTSKSTFVENQSPEFNNTTNTAESGFECSGENDDIGLEESDKEVIDGADDSDEQAEFTGFSSESNPPEEEFCPESNLPEEDLIQSRNLIERRNTEMREESNTNLEVEPDVQNHSGDSFKMCNESIGATENVECHDDLTNSQTLQSRNEDPESKLPPEEDISPKNVEVNKLGFNCILEINTSEDIIEEPQCSKFASDEREESPSTMNADEISDKISESSTDNMDRFFTSSQEDLSKSDKASSFSTDKILKSASGSTIKPPDSEKSLATKGENFSFEMPSSLLDWRTSGDITTGESTSSLDTNVLDSGSEEQGSKSGENLLEASKSESPPRAAKEVDSLCDKLTHLSTSDGQSNSVSFDEGSKDFVESPIVDSSNLNISKTDEEATGDDETFYHSVDSVPASQLSQ